VKINYLPAAFAAPVPDRLTICTSLLALAGLVVISLLMTGCAMVKTPPQEFLPPKTLSVTGYGTVKKSEQYSPSELKIMAMKASKMDAYRNLAEQLIGIQLHSLTTVENMEVSQDSNQGNVDAFLRGARVKSISPMNGSNLYAGDYAYETVVELELTPKSYECIKDLSKSANQCLQQNPDSQASGFDHNSPVVSSIKSGCNADDCYSYPVTRGFSEK
jgi:hypothetical protein